MWERLYLPSSAWAVAKIITCSGSSFCAVCFEGSSYHPAFFPEFTSVYFYLFYFSSCPAFQVFCHCEREDSFNGCIPLGSVVPRLSLSDAWTGCSRRWRTYTTTKNLRRFSVWRARSPPCSRREGGSRTALSWRSSSSWGPTPRCGWLLCRAFESRSISIGCVYNYDTGILLQISTKVVLSRSVQNRKIAVW